MGGRVGKSLTTAMGGVGDVTRYATCFVGVVQFTSALTAGKIIR